MRRVWAANWGSKGMCLDPVHRSFCFCCQATKALHKEEILQMASKATFRLVATQNVGDVFTRPDEPLIHLPQESQGK